MHEGTTNRSTARSRPRARRTDVEALRGWAVGGVLAYHLVGVPLGGVTGVDMFFAISGFLITDLLFREARTTGRVDLVAFILRRARRLVPMAVVVLAATIIAASFVWYRPRLLTTLLDALAAATSTENWHLIAAQTSYLQADAAVSPLQHFWSLSVEEQFYAAWPVAVAVTVAILVRLRRAPRLRLVLLGVAIAATAASLARSLYLTHENIDAAYFDTGARAWQLGLGAVTALAGPLLARISPSIRPWIVGAGALLALWSLLAVDPSRAFPMPGAIPAVVGTCLILGCGTGTERGLLRVLSPRPALWLGRHSYSVYLWHFPLVVFLPDILGQTAATPVLALAATLLLSAASFRFIEQPFLSRRWSITRRRRPDPAAPPPPHRRARSWIAPGLVLCLVGVCSFAQLRSPARLGDPSPLAIAAGWSADPSREPGAAFTTTSLESALSAAAVATTWPEPVRGELDTVFADRLPDAMDARAGCRHDPTLRPEGLRSCDWGPGDAQKKAVVIGDSVAASWTSSVVAALAPDGWRVEALTFSGCPSIDVEATPRGEADFVPRCAASRDAMIQFALDRSPDLIVLSDAVNLVDVLDSGSSGPAATTEWADGTLRTLKRLASTHARLVVLSNPPAGPSLATCPTRFLEPASCATSPDERYLIKRTAESRAVTAARRTDIDAHFVDVEEWFCLDGTCPAFLGPHLVRADRTHLTDDLGRALAPLLRGRLIPEID